MGRSQPIVIERITRGYGDGIMARPAVIGKINDNLDRQVILHIREPEACIFEDIENLEVVPIPTFPDDYLEGKLLFDTKMISRIKANRKKRFDYSAKIIDSYQYPEVYRLSSPCAEYEVANAPDIVKSRQQIFCDVLKVKFSMFNYNVKFSLEEEKFADDFLGGMGKTIGIHLRTADLWRDYRYMTLKHQGTKMWDLVEWIAKRFDGNIITFDAEWKYEGRLRNVKSLVHPNFRYVWAVMARMLLGIGPDSAGVHAFGSAFVPTYGLFGPTDPRCRLIYPYVNYSSKGGCPYRRQYCWYNICRRKNKSMVYCLNRRSVKYYWEDIKRKMGRFI